MDVNDIPRVTSVESCIVAEDFAWWLTGVRCLENRSGFESPFCRLHTYGLVHTMAKHMRKVQHWSIFRGGGGLYMRDIVREMAFESLVMVGIHGAMECPAHALQLDPKVCNRLQGKSALELPC